MSSRAIQRVDDIPLVVYWLLRMHVHEILDGVWPHPHLNRQGVSYGQLAVLFLAYVLHLRTHRLSGFEDWLDAHRLVLEQATGWSIGPKDGTDDRLGDLLTLLGEDPQRARVVQQQLGQHVIHAYALPTDVARFDTTTFSVYHAPPEPSRADMALFTFGHSKDRRPDLVQFKQSLGTLDPAGVPLLTATVAGKAADDPLYGPAWQEMVNLLGHRHFLLVGDCKAAALATRAQIDRGGGRYLFPLPLTGTVPDELRAWVLNPPVMPQPIHMVDPTAPDGRGRVVGQGFIVERIMTDRLDEGQTIHSWTERWLVTGSDALAEQQQHALWDRVHKAETALTELQAKAHDDPAELMAHAERIVQRYRLADGLTCHVHDSITQEKHYLGPGRPGPKRPFEMMEVRHAHLTWQRNSVALDEAVRLAGWRVHVTNTLTAEITLDQAITYYRGEWGVERGFHRFKRGSLPALPLGVRLPERVAGLMLLLMIALQALTLLEFVAERALAQRRETLAGLVPGNPKLKTARPSAERLLAQFTHLHLLVEQSATDLTATLVETLTSLQSRILALLDVPETVYRLVITRPAFNSFNSS